VCVLCQQPLAHDEADRLARFEAFICDTTSRDAATAEAQLRQLRDEFAALCTAPSGVIAAISQLQSGGEEVAPSHAWIVAAEVVAAGVVAWLDGSQDVFPAMPPTTPTATIEARRISLTDASAAIDAMTFNDTLRALRTEIAGLQATAQIAAAKENLGTEVGRPKPRVMIEEARRLTDTTGITRKATALTTEHVTSVVRDQFTRETERLHLRTVTLDPTSGRSDVTLEHRPRLLGATMNVAINNVLSEGE